MMSTANNILLAFIFLHLPKLSKPYALILMEQQQLYTLEGSFFCRRRRSAERARVSDQLPVSPNEMHDATSSKCARLQQKTKAKKTKSTREEAHGVKILGIGFREA
jgi:hypothetical protein